jgi:hypothetical protein
LLVQGNIENKDIQGIYISIPGTVIEDINGVVEVATSSKHP